MNVNRVWDGFDSVDKGLEKVAEELKKARADIPVTRHEVAELRLDLNKCGYRVSALEKRADNCYKNTFKICVFIAVITAIATALAVR